MTQFPERSLPRVITTLGLLETTGMINNMDMKETMEKGADSEMKHGIGEEKNWEGGEKDVAKTMATEQIDWKDKGGACATLHIFVLQKRWSTKPRVTRSSTLHVVFMAGSLQLVEIRGLPSMSTRFALMILYARLYYGSTPVPGTFPVGTIVVHTTFFETL